MQAGKKKARTQEPRKYRQKERPSDGGRPPDKKVTENRNKHAEDPSVQETDHGGTQSTIEPSRPNRQRSIMDFMGNKNQPEGHQSMPNTPETMQATNKESEAAEKNKKEGSRGESPREERSEGQAGAQAGSTTI